MKTPSAPTIFPFRAASPSGMSAELNSNGSVRRMDCGDIMLNVFLGNEAEGGLSNCHLRLLGETVETIPLIGPGSPASYQTDGRGLFGCGRWGDLAFRIRLVLAESAKAWFWHIELENTGAGAITCDLIHTQDIGIAHYGAMRLNEFYVSQYVDHAPLNHARAGRAVASRQNQSMGGRCPWTVIGSLANAVSWSTDALQFHGLATRAGGTPAALSSGLPGERLQHEHSLVAIQDEPFVLEPGAKSKRGFFGWFEADKPTATSENDICWIDAALALPEATCPPWPEELSSPPPAPGLFSSAPLLETEDLSEAEIHALFGATQRHAENENGRLWSFFTARESHVVLKGKELNVLRPHGHLLRSGGSLTPDESALTSTAWMNGVFHSMVTQGHVSINRFLSTCHSYLGLFRSHGQRVFIEIDGGGWRLLAMPSAFEMHQDSCRWIYKHRGGVIEVVSSAPDDRHELRLSLSIIEGPPARFLISHHIALNGDDGSASIPAEFEINATSAFVRAVPDSDVGRRFPDGGFIVEAAGGTPVEQIGGDELLFSDNVSHHQPFLCFVTAPSTTAALVMRGRLVDESVVQTGDFWKTIGSGLRINAPAASPLAPAAERAGQIFPWFIHNALVHYLSPRGLEQYSGGGWGTRDVCQGPVELLLALGRFEPVRDLLCRVFRQQNADGDWPQWFMFFDRERNIRPGDSHGDIVYWPLVALAQYLSATGDASLLDESLPFFHPDENAAEVASIRDHVKRALDLIHHRVIEGTTLAAYGHGDWNDSLQPAKPDMRERLCSSWTVTLNYQTHVALAAAFRHLGNTDRAAEFDTLAATILAEFQRVLIVDDVLTGLAYFQEDGKTDYLLHPRDTTTGLSYSLLAMIHAIINDMFSPEQAEAHLSLIRKHLLGPDGARLFDRPMAYHGGLMTNFQRAESASFFGREIGIMYTHAHLRYCEALARFGDADAFFHALSQLNPIAIRELVTTATPRQANCYYSSSDAAFKDRYQAFDEYDRVKNGEVFLEGGWRVYSSGAGIGVRLIMQCFLGLRMETKSLIIDPVIPVELDGLKADLRLAGHPVTVVYQIKATGCGTTSVEINGGKLNFTRQANPYRPGAARISMDSFTRRLTGDGDTMVISLG
ncbi:MAG: amylo-alpha-1,6-glucosidase [Verrucomicrobiota bacterium]